MGRLSGSGAGEGFGNVQYSRLSDDGEDSCSGRSCQEEREGAAVRVSVMPGYLSFSCRQCGHLQIFQGTELEMILGKSLKMAFRSSRKETREENVHEEDMASKNNIPMTVLSAYKAPNFQESADGSSLGIPMVLGHRSTLSSDESNSPTQMNQVKRIVDKPSLMKRIGKGFVLNTSDEEGYPLVSEGGSSVPGSHNNISSLNNEQGSSEATTLRIGEAKETPKQLHHGEHSSFAPKDGASAFPKKEGNLRMAPWYQEGIPREIALEILSQEPVGSFMVRRSTTKMGCFALSVRVPRSFQPRGIAHYLIMRTPKGYRIKGFTKEFSSLASLIAHHSVMPELLPCPLSLSRYHPVCVISDCRRDFADIEPEPNG